MSISLSLLGKNSVEITSLLFFDVAGFLHMLNEVFNEVGSLVAVRAPEQSPEVLYPPGNGNSSL